MAGISEEDIGRIREANDIVAVFSDRVPVRQRGRDFWCCCPIHEEKSPSCKIDPATQLWHCFGCGVGGDVFSFIMQADDLSFPEAARKLADRAGIHIRESNFDTGARKGYKSRLKEVCKESAAFFHMQLMRSKDEGATQARSYLSSRNFGGEIPKTWELGYAPGRGELSRHLLAKGFSAQEIVGANVAIQTGGSLKDRFYNRIMFPIGDIQGEVIAFGGRIVGEGQPKYLNSQETPIFHKSEILYGLHLAKNSMTSSGTAIVVEGYTDVISLHEAGLKNAVATLGTALTGRHIRMLSRYAKNRIIYLFDGDEAGQRAADRALSFIDESITPEAGHRKLEIMAVTLPDNLDPADYIETFGIDGMKAQLDAAMPLLSYGIDRRLAAHDLSSAEGRGRALADALQVLAPIKDSLLAKDYAVQIASKVHAREDDVLLRLEKLEVPRAPGREQAEPAGKEPEKGEARFPQEAVMLSEVEKNRRRFEREFLSLCASLPDIALLNVEVLAKTQWHKPVHALLAQSILDTLAEHASASSAELVLAAQNAVPEAGSILTSGSMTKANEPKKVAQFLAEGLEIGDMEEAISELRAQLNNPQGLDLADQEMLFATAVAMQKELNQKKLTHIPIVE